MANNLTNHYQRFTDGIYHVANLDTGKQFVAPRVLTNVYHDHLQTTI